MNFGTKGCMYCEGECNKECIPQLKPKQELDCPYDFTSRCTMGRCDCKPKQDCTCGVCNHCEEQETVQILKEAKETALKQETLEEAATRYTCGWGENDDEKAFIAGAKWQLENMPIHIYAENTYVHIEDGTIIVEKNDQTIISYSEDDLREAFKQSRQCQIFEKYMPPVYENFEEWFEQFYKLKNK
jgi:hypothetical protein